MNDIAQILEQLKNSAKLEDPNFLSNTAIELSVLLYKLNTDISEAEFEENRIVVGLLDVPLSGADKKISVAEAEKRALTLTENKYGMLKLQGQAVVEIIQSLKKKVDMLSFERRNS